MKSNVTIQPHYSSLQKAPRINNVALNAVGRVYRASVEISLTLKFINNKTLQSDIFK